MNTLAFAFASAVLVIPSERHIDCSGWTGKVRTEFSVSVTAMDGSVYKTKVELSPGSSPEDARDLIWFGLEEKGYRGHTVGKGILVLQGSKKSPIRSVTFQSEGWKPDVRVVLRVADKK